jgi:hypothetical protein
MRSWLVTLRKPATDTDVQIVTFDPKRTLLSLNFSLFLSIMSLSSFISLWLSLTHSLPFLPLSCVFPPLLITLMSLSLFPHRYAPLFIARPFAQLPLFLPIAIIFVSHSHVQQPSLTRGALRPESPSPRCLRLIAAPSSTHSQRPIPTPMP